MNPKYRRDGGGFGPAYRSTPGSLHAAITTHSW